jgi:hypothetical protein
LCINQETRERRIEAKNAVQKVSIVKPGTSFEDPQRRKTFISMAVMPKVNIEIGRAISCKMGRISVFTIPITMAATIAVARVARWKPGSKYSTTRRAATFMASLTISLMCLSIILLKTYVNY